MAFSTETGWTHYQSGYTESEKIWEGIHEEISGLDRHQLENQAHKFDHVHVMGQPSSSDQKFSKNTMTASTQLLNVQIELERRIKDSEEVALIERAAQIAIHGYKKFRQTLRPGMTERDLQVEYEAEISRHGSHKNPYETLIGSGANSAILHASPTMKVIEQDDLVLVDAGVDVYDYCVDITRVFPANGTFSSQGKMLYDLVKMAHTAGIENSVVGKDWPTIHQLTARIIADGLKSFGILKCDADTALESEAIALFYPHGVGHLVGLRVRDTGSPENLSPKKYCGAFLRVDLKLQENLTLTVEPGCYFIPALLHHPDRRKKFKDLIQWTEAEKWISVGGVRIEDDILVMKNGPPRVLTQEIQYT
jgi:Xaa-Pro dipeptidase